MKSLLCSAVVVLLLARSANVVSAAPLYVRVDVPPDQSRPELSTIVELWHQAAVAETEHDLARARTVYRKVAGICEDDPSFVRGWYFAASQFGIARTSSRVQDTVSTRLALVQAFEHEFWNFNIVLRDPLILAVAGQPWVDSLVALYQVERERSEERWMRQPPVILAPESRAYRDSVRRYWRNQFDSLRGVIQDFRTPVTGARSDESVEGGTHPATSARKADAVREEMRHRYREHFSLDSLRPSDGFRIHRPLIIALHGGNASYEEFASWWTRVADTVGAYVLVPAGVTRFSNSVNSWESNFSETSESVLRLIDSFISKSGYVPEVYLTGFSQGAKAALEIALVNPDRIRGVISIAGFLDQDLPPEVIEPGIEHGLRIYAISGDLDSRSFRASLELARKRCEKLGLPFKLEIVPGMVHEDPEDLPSRFAKAWSWIRTPGGSTVLKREEG
jgi:predicted esterase